MPPKVIYFVSENENKFKEVSQIFEEKNIILQMYSTNLVETQHASCLEVCKQKCITAFELIQSTLDGSQSDFAVIVDDSGLAFRALHGFPGPYIKWFLKTNSMESTVDILGVLGDISATAQSVLAFTDDASFPDIRTFEGNVDGVIVQPRGEGLFGWDSSFIPENSTKTFGEMTRKEKNQTSHRSLAARKLLKFVSQVK